MRLLLLLGLCLVAIPALAQTAPRIGPTPVPFYTGNLSVDSFMHYWGTRKQPPVPQVTPDSIAQLKRISCFAVCDYLSWPLTEKAPGRWDFSLYRDNAAKLNAAGIKYNVFCWLQFPPKWYLDNPDFVPYRCLEHNEAVQQMSLWSPATRRIYHTFYAELAKALGNRIAFIRMAMPSEYGEIGYPVGMTAWLMPQPHVHPGFWCGDPEARKAFRADALKRYNTLAALNAAWGTGFKTRAEIEYPSVAPADVARCRRPEQKAARRRLLDFIDWYQQSWTDFMVWSASEVKRGFPGFGLPQRGKDLRTRHEIIASLGYGAEVPQYGNDEGRHVAAMKRAGLSAQTPGDIGYFATRRVSSACALYGVPYYTEPPGDVSRDREVQRIWMDASNGAQVYFDYPQNLDGARDLFVRYKPHLTGRRSLTDFGLLLPTTTQFLHTDWGWPPHLSGFAENVRDRLDYEVLDERMVADGGLRKLGIRVLAAADSEYLEEGTLRALIAWVRQGGLLIFLDAGPIRAIDGSDTVWNALRPKTMPVIDAAGEPYLDAKTIRREFGRRIGKGYVVALPGGPERIRDQVGVVAELHDNLASFLPGARNGRRIDTAFDGIIATLFTERILYYNPTDNPIAKEVVLRPEDFGGDVGKPATYLVRLEIGPHSIVDIPLLKDFEPHPHAASGKTASH